MSRTTVNCPLNEQVKHSRHALKLRKPQPQHQGPRSAKARKYQTIRG